MSVNPIQSWVNQNSPYFLLVNADTINTKNLNALNISTGSLVLDFLDVGGQVFTSSITASGSLQANELSSVNLYTDIGRVSTLYTEHIILDQATLDVTNGNTLLLNGSPIATVGQLSNIADWSLYASISNVNMAGYNINNLASLNSQNIFNALNIQSDTASLLTSLTSPKATIPDIRATGVSTVNLLNTNNFIGNAISCITISTGGLYWSPTPAISAVNLAGYPLIGGSNTSYLGSNITIGASNSLSNTCRDYNLIADEGINIGSVSQINMTAQNGTYGAISLTANGGFNNGVNGVINLTANGSQIGGVGQGGSINLTANTPLGFSNLTSKISLNASGINSYAGSVPPLASAYGYNFMYGQNGCYIASGIPPGLPNTPGTTYIYGTTGIEMPSEAYMYGIQPYWNGLTTPPDLDITGRYITPNLAQVCLNLSNVRNLDFQSNVTTRITNIDSISMTSPGAITGVQTINGSPYPPSGPGSGITTQQLTSTTQGLGTIGYLSTIGPNILNISSIQGNKLQITGLSSIYGGETSGSSNYFNRFEKYFYNPPTAIGGAEIAISGKAQNAGAIVTNSLGVDLQTGTSYLGSFWDNYISMPLEIYGATISFESDNDYMLYMDGKAGAPATLSTGFTFYMASTITQKNQNLIANTRQPFIQYGTVGTSGATGNTTVTLGTGYANTNYVVTPVMLDTNTAQLAVDITASNTFDIYWSNGGSGSHTLGWTSFGDI